MLALPPLHVVDIRQCCHGYTAVLLYQGFSLVMTQLADRIRTFSKPRVGSGQKGRGFEISRVGSDRVGSGQEALTCHGSGRVGPRGFEISRVGSVEVRSKGFENTRVGSGHEPRDTSHVTGRATLTRELFFLTRG